MRRPLWFLSSLLCLTGVAGARVQQSIAAERVLGPPQVPPENPIREEKRLLGKVLFWDEQLSSDSSVACGTCHVPGAGGADPRLGPATHHPGLDGSFGTADDRLTSPGVVRADAFGHIEPDSLFGFARQLTGRRSPSNVGAAYFPELFWDGRAGSTFVDPETGLVSIALGGALESQSLGPILSSVEMADAGRTWDDVRVRLETVRPLALAFDLPRDLAARLASQPSYPELFEDAFGTAEIGAERIAFALATYQRTLIPDQTPWDRYQAGDAGAMTPAEKVGLQTFLHPGLRCAECHTPPLFSDGSYRNLGLRPIAEDPGRQLVTGLFSDRGRFKVPSLRNVGLRLAYFHNGAPGMPTLFDSVFFYDTGGTFLENRDPLLSGLHVTGSQASQIAGFLATGLTDPRVAAEAPPFDRPKLNSERPRPGPVLLGGGVAGSGGIEPQLVALAPPLLGNPSFRLGLFDALGGAPAYLVWSLRQPGGGGPGSAPFGQVVPALLAGSGPGGGYATYVSALPSNPVLAGAELWLQWLVRDPGAAGGFARSELVLATLF